MSVSHLRPPTPGAVRIDDAFWRPRIDTNRNATLRAELEQLHETGRIAVWDMTWKPGDEPKPHQFWDSDLAKWMEAVAWSLVEHPDEELEAELDGIIEKMAAAQLPDGYLNSYFILVEPDKRWTNLEVMHELYCAGHLIEAAVAYFQARGKRRFLDIVRRYADHICDVFGSGPHQKRGYPGHQELELALLKLYRATGEQRYIEQARFFIDERGAVPHYFAVEREQRGQPNAASLEAWQYYQAHRPVREQDAVVGHAVRGQYMYAAMADLAAETGDSTLLESCRRLWDSLTERRMYITGGAGSSRRNEGFTVDHDLPNADAYAETCASIALVFWAQRMANIERDGRYADVMERALYNGVLSGVSLDGQRFFYENPLQTPREHSPSGHEHKPHSRSPWFGCACCPPNIARLLASLGQYVCGQTSEQIWLHLYAAGRIALELNGTDCALDIQTRYPWNGTIEIHVDAPEPVEFTLALRLPGWCAEPALTVNDDAVNLAEHSSDGYAVLRRHWHPDDVVRLELPMPVQRMRARPEVRANAGRVALQRGPVVYCLEEVDNGPNLERLALPPDAEVHVEESELFGGCATLKGQASELHGPDDALYSARPPLLRPFGFTAVPYCMWNNRGDGEMLVWMREACPDQ